MTAAAWGLVSLALLGTNLPDMNMNSRTKRLRCIPVGQKNVVSASRTVVPQCLLHVSSYTKTNVPSYNLQLYESGHMEQTGVSLPYICREVCTCVVHTNVAL